MKKYKVNDGFILRELVSEHVVVYVGEDESFNGIITLNDTGVIVWNEMVKGATKKQMAQAVMQEYEIDENTAIRDAEKVVDLLLNEKVIRETGFFG